MDDIITISSDESDVEILDSYSEFYKKTDLLPLSEVKIDVETVNLNIPPRYIDLTDPKWSLQELKNFARLSQLSIDAASVIDLTEIQPEQVKPATENLLQQKESLMEKDSVQASIVTSDCNLQMDVNAVTAKRQCLDLVSQHPTKPTEHPIRTSFVKLTRLAFLEAGIREHKRPETLLSHLRFKKQNFDFEANRCKCNLKSTSSSNEAQNVPSTEETPPQTAWQDNLEEPTGTLLQDKEYQHGPNSSKPPIYEEKCSSTTLKDHSVEIQANGFHSPMHTYLPPCASPSEHEAQIELLPSSIKSLELNTAHNTCPASVHSPTLPPSTELTSCQMIEPGIPLSSSPPAHQSQRAPSPFSEHQKTETPLDWQMDIENGPGPDSPVSLLWQGESDEEDMNKEISNDDKFRGVSREERQIVCLDTLNRIISRPFQFMTHEDCESFSSEMLCRRTLSLVYSTIEENFPEATLQFLSDLLRPGYYPPKDITKHLLRDILLDPNSPHLLSVQAYNLLRRTQKHHRASRSTIPWDWDLLTSVLSNENRTKKYRSDVVRMFLDYVLLTLEDDFRARCSSSSVSHSIAKTVLSCNQHFLRVRDVIQWLFTAITKSTEKAQSRESMREKDEQTRIVSTLQRMLSLALEVDLSPALNAGKLSQELFHTLLSHEPSRAHRMLLLESLQNHLLKCKLLEHLLDYACPAKIPLPMSLSLLLHFLKNCTLAPDPTDGSEKWRKWEELVHLLWMLLLSYNGAMKGYLRSGSQQKATAGAAVFRQEDYLSKPAVREAVEAFLSRSLEDLGESLPLHVEESLTYLQDHLLDVCQC